MPPRRSRPLLALAVSVGLLALAEIGLRAAGFRHKPARLPMVVWDVVHDIEMALGESMHERDPRMLWVPRAGAPLPWAPEERVSRGGFRAADPDPAAALRVLTLGDSSTFGMGVGGGETYSAYLAEALRSDPELARRLGDASLQVLNGGTIGYTVRQGLQRYRAIREEWAPHVVVAAFGAVNEHFPMIVVPDREKIARERGQWGGGRRLYEWVALRSRLFQVALWWNDERRGGRKARILERVREIEARDEGFDDYLERPDYARRVSTEDFRTAHRELLEEVRGDGGRLIVMQMPRRPDEEERLWPILEYDPVLFAFARTNGVPHVDARARFLRRFADGADSAALFVDGFHPSPEGQRILADALFPEVRRAALESLGVARESGTGESGTGGKALRAPVR